MLYLKPQASRTCAERALQQDDAQSHLTPGLLLNFLPAPTFFSNLRLSLTPALLPQLSIPMEAADLFSAVGLPEGPPKWGECTRGNRKSIKKEISEYIRVYLYTHMYTQVYIHTHIYTVVHPHMYTYMYTQMLHTCTHINMCACEHACVSTCISLCAYTLNTCMHKHVCT